MAFRGTHDRHPATGEPTDDAELGAMLEHEFQSTVISFLKGMAKK